MIRSSRAFSRLLACVFVFNFRFFFLFFPSRDGEKFEEDQAELLFCVVLHWGRWDGACCFGDKDSLWRGGFCLWKKSGDCCAANCTRLLWDDETMRTHANKWWSFLEKRRPAGCFFFSDAPRWFGLLFCKREQCRRSGSRQRLLRQHASPAWNVAPSSRSLARLGWILPPPVPVSLTAAASFGGRGLATVQSIWEGLSTEGTGWDKKMLSV